MANARMTRPMATTPIQPVPPHSPLLSAEDIATRLFGGKVSRRWVLRTVCPDKRIEFTQATIRWREYDVLEWMLTRPPVQKRRRPNRRKRLR